VFFWVGRPLRSQLLTPKAELRAALIISDSVLVTRNPQGELGGVLVDIANALATSLSVPLHMVPYDNIIRYNQSIGKDEWDIALTPPTAGVERWHNNQSSHANFFVFALGSIKRMPQ